MGDVPWTRVHDQHWVSRLTANPQGIQGALSTKLIALSPPHKDMNKTNIKDGLTHLVNKPTKIKYVVGKNKARMWVKTSWDEYGTQKQEWSINKPKDGK